MLKFRICCFVLSLTLLGFSFFCSSPLEHTVIFRGDIPLKFSRTLLESTEGQQANITLKLITKPTSEVLVPMVVNDSSEISIQPKQLKFTPDNFDVPQTVQVSFLEDCEADGKQVTAINTAGIQSSDPAYQLGDISVNVNVVDGADNKPNIIFLQSEDLITSEDGARGLFQVKLSCKPANDVTIPLDVSVSNEVSLDKTSLLFTPDTFSETQVVTVTGISDCITDGDRVFTISTKDVLSDDIRFNRYHSSLSVDAGELRKVASVAGVNFDSKGKNTIFTDATVSDLNMSLDYTASSHPDPYIGLGIKAGCPLTKDTYFSFSATDNFLVIKDSPDSNQYLTFTSKDWSTTQYVLFQLNPIATSSAFFTSKDYSLTVFESTATNTGAQEITPSDYDKAILKTILTIK